MFSIVVGSIIGAGIFVLPVSLAPLGWNAAIGWIVSGSGALCLAFALAKLARGGHGIQAHIAEKFGAIPAFIAAWGFWCGAWTSGPLLALAASAALSRIDPQIDAFITPLAVAFVIILTAVNALGIRAAGRMQVLTTAIKIIPLFAVILIVLLHVGRGEPLQPMAASPISLDNIATAAALTLFAITGFENATAPVDKIGNAKRIVPLAMLLGTTFVALLYLLSSTSVSLLLSSSAVSSSPAPFADALASEWGETAVQAAAFCVAVSAFGCLNAGILACGELTYAMALKGDLPKLFAHTRKDGTPVYAQCLSAALGIGLIFLNSSRDTANLFTFIIRLALVGNLYLYLIGTAAALRSTKGAASRILVVVGVAFVLFAFYGAGLEANLWGLLLIATGLTVRTATRVTRSRRLAQAF
ncbi:APC family permease [Sphingomonas sediminicola]|uniref:Arginine/agmatine antiporter n=2 Tax=Sphingomonas sediminicola TaxID=386874 RepID=A0ABX6T7X5_9SPHN|nr:APC family permease [Sphingomonas sediminicola]QNP45770.1 APC family permease [Sphingomonas sediminicola]